MGSVRSPLNSGSPWYRSVRPATLQLRFKMRLLFANIFLISMMPVIHGDPIPDPDPNVIIEVHQEVYRSGCDTGCSSCNSNTGDNDKDNYKDHDEGDECFKNTTPECLALDGKCHKQEKGCTHGHVEVGSGTCSEDFSCICCAKEGREHHEGDHCFKNQTPECLALDGKCYKRERGCHNGTIEVGENVCSSETCICCAKEEKEKPEHEKPHHEGDHCFKNQTPECLALDGKCYKRERGCHNGTIEVGENVCSGET